MGITFLNVTVSNSLDLSKKQVVKCLVDTGATYSIINGRILKKLNIKPDDEILLGLADGSEIKRQIGEALFIIDKKKRNSTVIFGE